MDWRRAGVLAVLVVGFAGGALAEPRPYKSLKSKDPDGPVEVEAPDRQGRFAGAGREVRDIVSQPARDVGIVRSKIPSVLIEAAASPYSLAGLKTCRQLSTEIVGLTSVLGPDYGAPPPEQRGRAGAIASAGGRAVVNSVIPFRGVVREVTGAAPAERQYNAAVDAGLARRGFWCTPRRKPARNCAPLLALSRQPIDVKRPGHGERRRIGATLQNRLHESVGNLRFASLDGTHPRRRFQMALRVQFDRQRQAGDAGAHIRWHATKNELRQIWSFVPRVVRT